METMNQNTGILREKGLKLKAGSPREWTRSLVRWDSLALMGILVFAFTLRVSGLRFGLPYGLHYDETNYTGAALNVGAGIFGIQINPTGYTNLLFGEYAVYFLLGKLLGIFTSAADFERAYRLDPSMFLLIGRLTSALFGTLNTWLVYILGKRLHNSVTGLVGALFLAVTFLHVRDSHFAVPDITMSFFVSLAVLLSVMAVQRQKFLYFYLAVASAVFAIAAKWSAAPILLPVALAFFGLLNHLLKTPARWRQIGRITIVTLLIIVGVFLVGSFQFLILPETYYQYGFIGLKAGGIGKVVTSTSTRLPGWLFYLKLGDDSFGVILGLLVLAGSLYELAAGIRKKNFLRLLVVSFPLGYFLIIGSSYQHFVRYLLPIVPFVTLFAARFLVSLTTWIEGRTPKLGVSFAGIIVLAACIPPFLSTLRFNSLMNMTDTRVIAKEWIEANIPSGTRIAADWPVLTPPLATVEKNAPNSQRIYDILYLREEGGLYYHPVEWYKKNGYQYVIASSFIYDLEPPDPEGEHESFYKKLDQTYELVQEFRPYSGDVAPSFVFDEILGPIVSLWERDRPGPTLKVYRVQ